MTTGSGAVAAAGAADRDSAGVWSVTGPIPAARLGLTLPHEHLLADFDTPTDTPEGWGAAGRAYPGGQEQRRRYDAPLAMNLLGEISLGAANRDNWHLDERAHAVGDLTAYAGFGGTTLVDLTTPDLGRDPAALRSIAREAGVQVVMGCGWHHPAWVRAGPGPHADALREPAAAADHLMGELTEGAGPDGPRAGVIGELGPLDPSDGLSRTILVAAARASARTGAPIWIDRHPDPAVTSRALALLADSGADPARVALGHCDDLSPNPDTLVPLLDRVGFVAFDRLGRLPSVYSRADDQDVASAIFALAQRGLAGRVLLSHDVSAKADLLAWGGGGYAFLPQQFVPLLRMFGGDDALIRTITVDNPRRWLAGEGDRP